MTYRKPLSLFLYVALSIESKGLIQIDERNILDGNMVGISGQCGQRREEFGMGRREEGKRKKRVVEIMNGSRFPARGKGG